MFHTPFHKLAPEFPQAGQIHNDPCEGDDRVVVNQPEPDVLVTDHGSIALLSPQTREGMEWCAEYLAHAQRFGFAYAVEARYVADVVYGMQADGLKVA